MIGQFLIQAKQNLGRVQLLSIGDRSKASKHSSDFESIGILCCFDQHLILASVKASQSSITIEDCASIDLPTHLIGDSGVENTDEVSQIVLDLMELQGMSSKPILLLLSSSKFRHVSFASNEIRSWDMTDVKVRGKSPFLPDETIIDRNVYTQTGKSEEEMSGVCYANSGFVDSWLRVLRGTNCPVIGVSPLYSGLIDWISNSKQPKETIVVCDVEPNHCNVLVRNPKSGFTSFDLPFGTALYEDDPDRLVNQFFKRLQAGLNVIEKEQGLPEQISYFLTGYGLGRLGSSLRPKLGSWTLMDDIDSHKINISKNINQDERDKNEFLFQQLSISLSSYLQP